jgi:hypothetical protein
LGHGFAAAPGCPLRSTARGSVSKTSKAEDFFEYDRPSSFFGQYGDDRVTEVGRNLDAALEAVLRAAAE